MENGKLNAAPVRSKAPASLKGNLYSTDSALGSFTNFSYPHLHHWSVAPRVIPNHLGTVDVRWHQDTAHQVLDSVGAAFPDAGSSPPAARGVSWTRRALLKLQQRLQPFRGLFAWRSGRVLGVGGRRGPGRSGVLC